MATAKALEYNGKILLVKEMTPIEQLWCMAKQKETPERDLWSNMWWCHKHYGCEYQPEIMQRLAEIDRLVYDGLFKHGN